MMKKLAQHFDIKVIFIVAIAVAWPALYQDLFRPITTTADPDLVYVYQTLLINEGLPQYYFDHTGYVYFIILSYWFKFLHLIGLVPIIKLSGLQSPAIFEPAYTALIYGGRIFSILLATICSVIFFYIVKNLTNNKILAASGAIIFALLPGLSVHAIQMRTELPSILFVYLAFLMLLYATQSRRWIEFIYVAAAAFFAVLATMSKVQIIPLVMAIPVIVLILRCGLKVKREPAFLVYSWPQVSAIGMLTLAISIPSQVMVWTQVFPALPERHNVGNHGYQFLMLAFVVLVIFVYTKIDRRTYLEFILALCAVSFGFAMAFYTNYIHHNMSNTAFLVNFVEHMAHFASNIAGVSYKNVNDSQLFGDLYLKIKALISEVGVRNFFAMNSVNSTLMPLGWFVIFGAAAAIYFKNIRMALALLTLLLTGLGMEVFSGIRSFASHYRIYAEPLLLLAAILLVGSLLKSKLANKIAGQTPVKLGSLILFGAMGIFILTGSLSFSFSEKEWNPRLNGCIQSKGYMPELTSYFCSEQFLHAPKPK